MSCAFDANSSGWPRENAQTADHQKICRDWMSFWHKKCQTFGQRRKINKFIKMTMMMAFFCPTKYTRYEAVDWHRNGWMDFGNMEEVLIYNFDPKHDGEEKTIWCLNFNGNNNNSFSQRFCSRHNTEEEE